MTTSLVSKLDVKKALLTKPILKILFISLLSTNSTVQAKNQISLGDLAVNYSTIDALNNNIDLQSSCGATVERKDVACSADEFIVEYERSRPIARIVTRQESNGSLRTGMCTAWRVGKTNLLMTNNHCIASQERLDESEFWFNFDAIDCAVDVDQEHRLTESVIKVTGGQLLVTDYDHDFTLFKVKEEYFDKIEPFGYFGLDVREPLQGERIYIPQHGYGNPKQLSILSDMDASGFCTVQKSTMTPEDYGRAADTSMGYFCDTVPGSSGSPVLSRTSNNVIALHNQGGCENSGVKISDIWPLIEQYFPQQAIPTGDNHLVDVKPNAKIISHCQDNICQLSASRSTDGNSTQNSNDIAQYSWLIAGNTINGMNINHTFTDVSASHQVSLTVVDHSGLSDNTTLDINVLGHEKPGISLSNGQTINNINSKHGYANYFYIDVPESAVGQSLDIKVVVNEGFVDLGEIREGKFFRVYVTDSNNDQRLAHSGKSTLNQGIEVLGAGRHTIKIYDVGSTSINIDGSYSGVSLTLGYDSSNGEQTCAEDPTQEKCQVSQLSPGVSQFVSAESKIVTEFTIDVTEPLQQLVVTTSGNNGDADLFVNFDSASTGDAQCRSRSGSSNESCVIDNPQLGRYFISVEAYKAFENVTLVANLIPQMGCVDDCCTENCCQDDCGPSDEVTLLDESGLSSDNLLVREVIVPARKTLTVTSSGGTGDADLFVKFGSQPVLWDKDCGSSSSSNIESCSITNTQAGTYYIVLDSYEAFTGIQLKASYQ
ncbi:pre-peptidase C-terminal domain-containing protein [Colwellia psychrerythraea]|uniref:Serine protease n=1 Tax=Colwellia psychrerythraea TaxID=28229 RepID=A0A099KV82_COLPS|nr:pre-peptidase C-terminal domain-containing protein [Colwellia psychrerythraea]KGJ93772.1 peptidase domain protein [Colwellia psychrerythraea]